jgi:protein TonB
MYRSDLDKKDKGGAIAAVIGIHAALLFVFLHLSGPIDLTDPQRVLSVFEVTNAPPPPPPPPSVQQQQPRPKEKAGAASPKNIKSDATPVVAPKPRVETPPVQQIAASETPRQGAAPTQGATNERGPGTGAGGVGAGTGSGAGGNGPGGGGDYGAAEPPRLVTPVLSGRDFPRDMLEAWPGRSDVFLRLRIDPAGYVAECIIDRGTGIPDIDSDVCALVHQRLRFRPALNRVGQPVAGWFGYRQTAPR